MLIMRAISIFVLLSASLSLFGFESEEALALRRIRLLFQEKEYSYAEKAIDEFFGRFPASLEKERLNALQGDIAFETADFEKALDFYGLVSAEILQKEIQKRKWQALFALTRYPELAEETKALSETDTDALFWHAKAVFLVALESSEKKRDQLWAAEELYRRLEGCESYALESKEALAAIYKELKEEKKMYAVLKELAEMLLKKQRLHAELALKTGRLLANASPSHAGALFNKLVDKGEGALQQQAAFLLFSHLVKVKNFDSLVDQEKKIESLLKPSELALLKVALGSFFSSKKEYALALQYYECALDLPLGSPYERQAVMGLVFASKMSGAKEKLERAYSECQKRFPDAEEDLAKIELVLASVYKTASRFDDAMKVLESASKRGFYKEEVILEKIRLLTSQERLADAADCAKQAALELPKSKAIHEARIALWKPFGAALECEKERSEALKQALLQGELFDSSEKMALELMLARSLIAQNKAKEANLLLENLMERGEHSFDLYMLAAWGHFKESKLEKAIQFGELALEQRNQKGSAEKRDGTNLYLPLFNAYLSLAKEKAKARDASWVNLETKAAEHLQNAIDAGLAVSLENRAWLFRRIAAKARLFAKKEEARAALSILAPILQEKGSSSRFEAELTQAAGLWGLIGQPEQGLELLGYLSSSLEGAPKCVDEAELERADLLLLSRSNKEAIALLEKLQTEAASSFIRDAARMKLCRLETSAYEKKKLPKELLQSSIDTFTELKNRRNASGEPLYLEAAIDLALALETHFSAGEKNKKLYETLIQLKREFQSEDDIVSRDYHELMVALRKKELFDMHMDFLEGWALSLQAEMTSDSARKKEIEKRGRDLLAHVERIATPYLKAQLIELKERL